MLEVSSQAATVSHPDWTPERGKAETGSVSVALSWSLLKDNWETFFFF